ncbi:glycosyltransferase family 1 protein, partial [Priestia megaterium]|uniref:glycosyltransferase family 4 protein n=1 Tax=Priestia megaterium TaxID=1404 RepID=UPI002FFEA56B
VYNKIFSAVSKRSKHIITVSEFSKNNLIHHFPMLKNKISYSHLGIEHVKTLEDFDNKEILKKFNLKKHSYFLAVSSANPNKNFKIISDMLEKSSSFEEDFILVGGTSSKVFGEGTELSQKIRHLGYVTDDELIALYSNAKAFIFPSKYEGFGLPPVEAMSQGCPVIASNCASIPEVLENEAIYFNNEDYNSLYASLNKINEINIDRQALLSFVNNKYSWKKTTKHLYDIILEM